MKTMNRNFFFACLMVAGCGTSSTVVIDGQTVVRPTFEYGGDAYHLLHRRAHPRPTKTLEGPGGDMTGRICGMDVDLDVKHQRDRIVLVGSLDSLFPVRLEIRDDGGKRTITGNLGGNGVELALTGNGLIGHVGLRMLSVEQMGDALIGFIRTPNIINLKTGEPGAGRIFLGGRDALWALPPAAQAAIVPIVLTCAWMIADTGVVEPLKLRFGGEPADRPPQSSMFYRVGR